MVKRVLVVDNDAAIREFLSFALSDIGLCVATANDVATALELAAGLEPDLILLEMRLPLHQGQTFFEAYFQLDSRHAPVIAMSTSLKQETAAIRLGAVAFLLKPFALTELLSHVEYHLQC